MMSKNEDETSVATSALIDCILSKEHLKAIHDIAKQKENQEEKKKQKDSEIKEAIEALASELGVKPAEISTVVNTVLKERKKRGHIDKEEKILDIAQQAIQS